MRRYHFVQADVFTDRPFGGNQLAVFTNARGLSAEDMQTLTREMNYSECTFVLPPEIPNAAKRVRIFTPARELPMAGHPTVGTTYVLARRGELDLPDESAEVTLQLGIGPVPVTIEKRNGAPGLVWMTHREPVFGSIRDDRDQVAQALGIAAADVHPDWPLQIVSTGVPFLFVPLRSLDAIGRCGPNEPALKNLFDKAEPIMVFVFTAETVSADTAIHARMFGSHVIGVPEDPATGGAAAPLGAYVARHEVLPRAPEIRFICEQGIEMGRRSRIHVEVHCQGETITELRIGGQTVIVGEGEIFWE